MMRLYLGYLVMLFFLNKHGCHGDCQPSPNIISQKYRVLISGLIKGKQWVFIGPDHKALQGGYVGGGLVDYSHDDIVCTFAKMKLLIGIPEGKENHLPNFHYCVPCQFSRVYLWRKMDFSVTFSSDFRRDSSLAMY